MDGDFSYPFWDDLFYSYPKDSDLVHKCRFDHGMMGVDILRNPPTYDTPISVSFPKSYMQKCFHSVTPSMPCVTPKTNSEYFWTNLNYKKNEKIRLNTIRSELMRMKKSKKFTQHEDTINLLINDPSLDIELPKFLKRYKKILMKTPDKYNHWQHHKGSLITLNVQNENFALFSGGQNFNCLMKLALTKSDWYEESKVHNLKTKCVKTFDVNDGPILQIATAHVHDCVYGALRQRKKCYLYKIKKNCKISKVDLISTNDDTNDIIDISLSPYIGGEYVYLTQNGAVEMGKIESKTSINVGKNLINHKNPLIGVQFGPHPRSLVTISTDQVKLIDLRSNCKRSLPLLTFPNLTLPQKDSVCTVSPYPENDDLFLLTTSSSALLIDQRYPDVYRLKWTHLLSTEPEMTAINTCPRSREVLILAGSGKDQEVAMMHGEKNGSQIYTRCPTMHLARPRDLLRMLPRGESHPVESLLTSPVIGIGVFSQSSFATSTVLQLTASGNIYAQNVSVGEEKGYENDWRVGPEMWRKDDVDGSETLETWAEEEGEKCKKKKSKKPKHDERLDESCLRDSLSVESVGPSALFSKAIEAKNVFETDGETFEGLNFGLREIDVESYDDEMSKTLSSVWRKDDFI